MKKKNRSKYNYFMVSLNDLKQYRFISLEIEAIEDEEKQIQEYRKLCIKIGADAIAFDHVSVLKHDKIIQLNEKLDDLNAFIESIEDDTTKQAVTLKYCKGYTWSQISNKLSNGYVTSDCYTKMVSRYLKKHLPDQSDE